MKNTGLQLDPKTGDLAVNIRREAQGKISGGLLVGFTEPQNKALILMANKGEFFFYPTLGVAIDEVLLDDDYLRKSHQIVEELAKDGFKVSNLVFAQNKPLEITGAYE